MARRTKAAIYKDTLEALADWLLGDSVSFAKLEGFRKALKLDAEDMSRVLGISPQTYATYRRRREVKLGRFREQMHQSVLGCLPVGDASRNARFEAIVGPSQERFERHVFLVGTPSRTTPAEITSRNSPHLRIPLRGAAAGTAKSQQRVNLIRDIRALHAGDDPCECAVCGDRLKSVARGPDAGLTPRRPLPHGLCPSCGADVGASDTWRRHGICPLCDASCTQAAHG